MNLYLHGVEPHIYLGDTIYEPDRGERYGPGLRQAPAHQRSSGVFIVTVEGSRLTGGM